MTTARRPFFIWLIIITAIGGALRVYHFTAIPFTYDELSALMRTHFASFGELIRQGVAADGHPAGVQVFLFYWIKLVGETEWLVKLPFIIMGVLCIPLIYKIGAAWFNRNTGILAACLVAGLQYTVMYSQIARPYISGLFFVLLLVVIWNSVMIKATGRNLIAYAVVLALCAYNHYFSMLSAAGIAITGILVIDRKNLFRYTLALLLSVLLFVPHIHLFFEQLKLKGLEWVQAPAPEFFKNYFCYVLNFSNYILASILLLLIQGAYFYWKRKTAFVIKYRFIALLWFVIPAAVGYFYSVYRAPVLENSVLIFGFPFLVLFICSFITLPDSYIGDIEIGALMLVLVVSLTCERNYFKLFYHAETEMFARHISDYEAAYGNNKVAAVVNTNTKYLDYYKKKYNTPWGYTTFDSIGDNAAWRTWLAKSNAQYLIMCNPPQEWGRQYLPIATEYFHCIDSVYNGFTTDIFILKRDSVLCKPEPTPLFTYVTGDSTGVRIRYKIQPMAGNVYEVCDTPQYELFFSALGPSIGIMNEKEKINVSVDVYVDSVMPSGYLSMRFIGRNGHVEQERKSTLEGAINSTAGWHKFYLTARLYHSPLKDVQFIDVNLVAGQYSCIKFKDFRIEVVPDNPFLYALIKKQ